MKTNQSTGSLFVNIIAMFISQGRKKLPSYLQLSALLSLPLLPLLSLPVHAMEQSGAEVGLKRGEVFCQ